MEANLARLAEVRDLIDRLSDDEDIDPALEHVETFIVYMTPALADAILMTYNVKPEVGKAGTNRRVVADNITELQAAIERGEWKFTHQGIAFNINGDFIDGQHRLSSIVRAGKTDPSLSVPMLCTLGLPLDSNTKVDLVRRRSVATFLAMEGYASSGHLNTTLRLLFHYSRCDFDRAGLDDSHWRRIITLEEARATMEMYPLAASAINVASHLRKLFLPSAAAAGFTLCRTRYPEAQNMEFVSGMKQGLYSDAGDPRKALADWALNQKLNKKRVTGPVYLAAYLKAFTAFRTNTPMKQLSYKQTTERFPRA